MSEVCICLTVWIKTNTNLLEIESRKKLDLFQFFVLLWPGVAKWQHVCIRLSISSLDSKMESSNIHT